MRRGVRPDMRNKLKHQLFSVKKPEEQRVDREKVVKGSKWFTLFRRYFKKATPRSFLSWIGCTPFVLDKMWSWIQLYVSEVEVKPEPRMRDLLMTIAFCRVNLTEDQAHSMFDIATSKTFRSRKKMIFDICGGRSLCDPEYILKIDPPTKEMDPPFNVGYFAGWVDGVECFVNKFTDFNVNRSMFSGYKKRSSFKYMVFSSFNGGYLLQWEGNWGGNIGDEKCLAMCKKARLFFKRIKTVIGGDSKFSSLIDVYTPVEYRSLGSSVLKEFCGRRSVVEHVIGQFSKFRILSDYYRGSKCDHFNVFSFIGNLVYLQLLESPLRPDDTEEFDWAEEEDGEETE